MKRQIFSFIILAGAMLVYGCYPKGPDSTEDFDLVITHHDVGFDFSAANTFAIPDSVIKITGNLIGDDGGSVEFVNTVYGDVIIANVRENLSRYGWTEVGKNASPDVFILPSALQTTNIIYYDYYYYPYYYWDWYYPYYWGGWYYPYPMYAGSYSSGSVFVQMVYPAGKTAADNTPVIWSALLNGVLDGSTTTTSARIGSSLDRAFDESPYLDQGNN